MLCYSMLHARWCHNDYSYDTKCYEKNRKAVEFCRKNNLIELLLRKKNNYINNARGLTVIIITKTEKYWIGERIKYFEDKEDLGKNMCFKEKTNPRQILIHVRKVGGRVLILSEALDIILFWIFAIKMFQAAWLVNWRKYTKYEQFIKFVEHKFQEWYSKDLWLIQSSLIIKNAGGVVYALEREQVWKTEKFSFSLHLLLSGHFCSLSAYSLL